MILIHCFLCFDEPAEQFRPSSKTSGSDLGAVLFCDWTNESDRERVGPDVLARVSGRFFSSHAC